MAAEEDQVSINDKCTTIWELNTYLNKMFLDANNLSEGTIGPYSTKFR